MKRWAFADMLAVGRRLFAKIHKQKRFANPNNDVHFMAREMDDWLVKGIQTLMDGTYTPRFLKRYYFKDEMVDQLHLSDRILQHIILKQLKPTFAHVMHPRCYHLHPVVWMVVFLSSTTAHFGDLVSHWSLSPPDQQLLVSLEHVVGGDIRMLGLSGIIGVVFYCVQGIKFCRRLCGRIASQG